MPPVCYLGDVVCQKNHTQPWLNFHKLFVSSVHTPQSPDASLNMPHCATKLNRADYVQEADLPRMTRDLGFKVLTLAPQCQIVSFKTMRSSAKVKRNRFLLTFYLQLYLYPGLSLFKPAVSTPNAAQRMLSDMPCEHARRETSQMYKTHSDIPTADLYCQQTSSGLGLGAL